MTITELIFQGIILIKYYSSIIVTKFRDVEVTNNKLQNKYMNN